ncbi:uncharacterized protein CANTADRAFT_41783, partial [Suhomyces tanzawaensis NRRL Y-17324]
LPTSVLVEICANLDTPALLSLCLSCKLLYLPAAIELYRKIVVCDDAGHVQTVKACTSHAARNLGTLICSSKLQALVSVALANDKIASILRNICLLGNSAAVHQNLLGQLLLKLEIHTLVVPKLTIDLGFVPVSVRTLHIAVENVPSIHLYLPNLQQLRVSYSNQPQAGTHFTHLAVALGATGSLSNLKTLQFSETMEEDDNLGLLNSLNNLNIAQAKPEPPWLQFFLTLTGELQLELTSLSLDGYIGNNGCKLVQILATLLQPERLEKLELHLKELTHPNSPHDPNSEPTTFMSQFTRLTPNLRSLGSNPTYDCLFCQFEALIQSLTNLQGKLWDLHLSMESLSIEYISKIDFCIITQQPNIKNLRVVDKSRQVNDQNTLLKCMSGNKERFSYYEYGLFYGSWVRDTFFSDVFLYDLSSLSSSVNRVTNDYMVQFIESAYHNGLNEFMKYYLNIGYSPFIVSGFDLVKKLARLEYLETVGVGLVLGHGGRWRDVYYDCNGEH